MQFKKYIYKDEITDEIDLFITKRVEYFFHYWQTIFVENPVRFDKYYLKSHRTIIEKVKLQIEGNFENARKRIDYFFFNSEQFNNNDIVIKKIINKKVGKSILKLKSYVLLSNNVWKTKDPKEIIKPLLVIEKWFANDYSNVLSDCILEILEKKHF